MQTESKPNILEILLANDDRDDGLDPKIEAPALSGLVVAVLSDVDATGQGKVAFDTHSARDPIVARTVVPIGKHDVGRTVCVMFELASRDRPIIMGFLHTTATSVSRIVDEQATGGKQGLEVKIDGERIVLEAKKEIVLRCGKASITLTQDGRVLLRGTYLSSRSSGPNLIKGGSVQLN